MTSKRNKVIRRKEELEVLAPLPQTPAKSPSWKIPAILFGAASAIAVAAYVGYLALGKERQKDIRDIFSRWPSMKDIMKKCKRIQDSVSIAVGEKIQKLDDLFKTQNTRYNLLVSQLTEEANARQAQLQKEIDTKKAEITSLEATLLRIKRVADPQVAEDQSIEDFEAYLASKVREYQATKRQTQAMQEQMEQEMRTRNAQIAQNNANIEAYQNALNEAQQRVNALQTSLEEARSKSEEEKGQLETQLETEIHNKNVGIEMLTANISRLEQENENTKQQLNSTVSQLETLTQETVRRNEEIEQVIQRLRYERDHARNNVAILEGQLLEERRQIVTQMGECAREIERRRAKERLVKHMGAVIKARDKVIILVYKYRIYRQEEEEEQHQSKKRKRTAVNAGAEARTKRQEITDAHRNYRKLIDNSDNPESDLKWFWTRYVVDYGKPEESPDILNRGNVIINGYLETMEQWVDQSIGKKTTSGNNITLTPMGSMTPLHREINAMSPAAAGRNV